jgi:5,10-methenyltetrahydromethanopterin hydrogenase
MTDEWGIVVTEEVELEEYKAPKARSMWDIMNSSIDKKIKPTQKEKEKINEFMFHKLLAKFEATLDLALIFTTKDIPVDKQYDIVNSFVPKGKVPFERKKKVTQSDTIDNIAFLYNCSTDMAEQYLELMPEFEIERINKKFIKGKV